MSLVQIIRLEKMAGRKRIYEIDLLESKAGFLVNYRYGWEGRSLTEGTRTPDPVSRDDADRIIESMRLSCRQRGFFEIGEKAAPSLGAPVAVPKDETDPYAAKLLARLETFPVLKDEKAAGLLFALGNRGVRSALSRILDFSAGLAPSSHPATCRILPYVLWQLWSEDWNEDISEILTALSQKDDLPTSDAARIVLAELAQDLSAGRFDMQPVADASELATRLAAASRPGRWDKAAHDQILSFYVASRLDPAMRPQFLVFLKDLPFQAGLFRSIRRVFKAAEAFNDAPVFGLLAQRFATEKAGYPAVPSWGRQWSPYLKDAMHENAGYAFGKNTRTYLNRRVARHLKSMGGFDRPEYTALATMCLISGPAALSGALHYPAQDAILNGDTPDGERQERYPDLWDDAPGHLLEILLGNEQDAPTRFAARALQDNADYCRRIRPKALARLFRSRSSHTRGFARWTVENRLADGRLTHDLLCVVLAQPDEDTQKLGQTALQLAPEKWLSDPAQAAQILASLYQASPDWLVRFLETAPLDETAVLDHLVQNLSQLPATPDAQENLAFDRVKARLLAQSLFPRFDRAIGDLAKDILTDLSRHARVAVRLFAVHLAAHRSDGVALFDAQALAQSEDPELQAGAAALLAGAEISVLKNATELVTQLVLYGEDETRSQAHRAVHRLVDSGEEGRDLILPPLLNAMYQDEPREGVHDELTDLFGLNGGPSPRETALQDAVQSMGPDVTWSLIRARSGVARRLGAAVLQRFEPTTYSLRKTARIGVSDQKLARDWAIESLRSRPSEVETSPQDIFTLLDGDWDDSRAAAYDMIRQQGSDNWPDAAVLALCDCISEPAQQFGRELLAQRMTPDKAPEFLMRLAEHPANGFRLTIARLIRDHSGDDPQKLAQLVPAIRRMLQRVHSSRAAKEQIWRFMEERITQGSSADRDVLSPIIRDMSASVTRADRDRAIALMVQMRRVSQAAIKTGAHI